MCASHRSPIDAGLKDVEKSRCPLQPITKPNDYLPFTHYVFIKLVQVSELTQFSSKSASATVEHGKEVLGYPNAKEFGVRELLLFGISIEILRV